MEFSPNTKVEWSREAVLLLIQEWQRYECLYNTKNQLYHNKHARNAAWEKVAKQLEIYVCTHYNFKRGKNKNYIANWKILHKYNEGLLLFLQENLCDITNKTLRDELSEEIISLVMQCKRKQRVLDTES